MQALKIVASACCCGTVVIILALLITYGVRLGTGDESHTLDTVGTCRNGTTDASALSIMTLNTFLIPCLPGVKCQEEGEREDRIREVAAWFEDRDEDVVMFQEVWSHHEVLRDGMTNAGFCHFVTTERTTGSGLAIFSKYPIEEQDFSDWVDAFGIGESFAPNPFNLEWYLGDKGVMYAKLNKDGQPIHLFNLHANSDSSGNKHDIRIKQFNRVRDFVDSKNIPSDELVLMGGDFNEDKDCRLRRCEGEANCEGQDYYNEMIEILLAGEPDIISNSTFTYDTEANTLLKSIHSGSDCDYYQYTLDYIFYSEKHLDASSSSCEVLDPSASEDGALSDHLPVSCTFRLGTNMEGDATIHSKEPT